VTKSLSVSSLARFSARRPWRILALWGLILVIAVGLMAGIGIKTSTEMTFLDNPESVQADNLLLESGLRSKDPVTETVIVRVTSGTIEDAQPRAAIQQITNDLRAMPEVVDSASVTNYFESGGAAELISADHLTTLIPVTLLGTLDEATTHVAEYMDVINRANSGAVQALTVGDLSVSEATNTISEEDLAKGESIGIGAALIILVVVFGALVVAGLPITLAIAAIMAALGMTAIVSHLTDLSFFVINMITMIGLAVGIDYALFVVERYREERQRGSDKLQAIEIAGGTASKAVLFSGMTVIFGLAGLFLVPNTLFRSLGLGAILVVAAAIAAVLTLIPALISLLGDKLDWPRMRFFARKRAAGSDTDDVAANHGFWARITHLVMTRPIVSAVLAITILVAAALPYLTIETGFAGVETMPASDVRTGFNILDTEFSSGLLAPVDIAIDGPRIPETEAALARLTTSLLIDGAFQTVSEPVWSDGGNGSVGLMTVTFAMDSNSPAAYKAIDRLRGDLIPAAGVPVALKATGATANNTDFFNQVDKWTPIVFAFVLALSFVLLMLAFRSIVVPAKAIVLNLLSVGAAYGLVVLVFQHGVGADLFGFQKTATIEAWLPLFLFTVLFGLSMDYHVFLLSRIREHYDRTGNNAESVQFGLQSTAKIITGAALIMVAVFGGFATGRLVFLQQMGFGLAVAVLLDATVVRSVLLPASMVLLGDRNWYLPRFLHWLPDLRIEGTPVETAPVRTVAITGAGAD
jgi:putative drug exporter of the RND superfamily